MGGTADVIEQDRNFINFVELAQFSRMSDFLLEGLVMRILLAGMRFARVDYEKPESPISISTVEFRQWRNLPHKRRSRYAAEFHKHMLLVPERRQRNLVAVEIGQGEIRRWATDLCNRAKIGRAVFTLSERIVIVILHGFLETLKGLTEILSATIYTRFKDRKPVLRPGKANGVSANECRAMSRENCTQHSQ